MIKNKQKKIAIIYEGVKTEENLFHNLTKHFFAERADILLVTLPAAGNLYMLWAKLQEDDFETNVISVLKEMNRDVSERLKGIDVLQEMLKTFNNETELGKLYISYPMIESIKEISINEQDYLTFYLPLEECSSYKEKAGGVSDYSDFRYITKEMWYAACNASRKRASIIVCFKEETDYDSFIDNITQENIYQAQKDKFINTNKAIGILNAVPLFLLEYYDEVFWKKICVH